MIIVRDVFRLKFGKAKEVKALMTESKKLMDKESAARARAMFDLVGPSYTMAWENSFQNLAAYEQEMAQHLNKKEWGEWYQKFVPLVENSYREIFTVYE